MIIGATTANNSSYLVDNANDQEGNSDDDCDTQSGDYEGSAQNDDNEQIDDHDFDEIFVTALDASRPGTVDAKHLSIICRIQYEDVKRTLDVTTQHNVQAQDPRMTPNYRTYDRMLRYKRTHECFFMDTIFATNKGGQSSWGNTCCQLFVTDKGYLYMVLMKQRLEVLVATKQFVKDVGASNNMPPTCFVKSHQDLDKSVCKPMAEYHPEDLIGRTFLLPPNQKGECHQALIKQKVIELSDHLDSTHDKNGNKINLLLDVGQGRSQAIMSYNQLFNYLIKGQQEDDSLYKFRAITNCHGPLKPSDPSYNGSLYNVMIEWETVEITEEPLNSIAKDDPVTCAAYAKQHNLLELPKWKKLRHIAKHQKTLSRAINQTKIRQVRRSVVCQFGFLIPRDYKHALELDKLNGISRWYDATMKVVEQINDYKVFKQHGTAQYDPKSKRIINAPIGYQKIKVHLVFACKHNGYHKARLFAGGHLTPDPIHSIYSGVVSTRSLRLTIFLAKLNNMNVWAADIGNA